MSVDAHSLVVLQKVRWGPSDARPAGIRVWDMHDKEGLFRVIAMTDDQLKEWASKAASEIVKREGAALALSACDGFSPAIEADSNLLGIAIAQAIIAAYRAGAHATIQRRK